MTNDSKMTNDKNQMTKGFRAGVISLWLTAVLTPRP
jgi:hypothetical protein